MHSATMSDITTNLRDDIVGAVEQFSTGIMLVCCQCSHSKPTYTFIHSHTYTHTSAHTHTHLAHTLSHTHNAHKHNTGTTHTHTHTLPTLPVNVVSLPCHSPVQVNSVLDSFVTTTSDLQTGPLDPTQPLLTYTTVRDLWWEQITAPLSDNVTVTMSDYCTIEWQCQWSLWYSCFKVFVLLALCTLQWFTWFEYWNRCVASSEFWWCAVCYVSDHSEQWWELCI